MSDAALSTFERLFGPEFGHGKGFDLAVLRGALAALGDPQANLPPVIHVAGTNGKGSAIAFMREIAEAAGLTVHAFTKPHLFCLAERFLVAGEPVSDAALIEAAERVAHTAPGLTQFDAQAASAFLLFSETPADLVLLETGMGGRDDSTNLIAAPAATVLAPIDLDHQDALGATLAEITAHKAGILKRNTPAIVARQQPEVMELIETQAAGVGAPLFRSGVEWDAFASNGRLVVQTGTRVLDLPLPALVGEHQIDNAGLACAALMRWRDLPDAAFAKGIAAARWPARLQPLTRGPLSAPIRALGGEVWVDCGHNAHAGAALARALQDMNRRTRRTTVAIIALRARKDAAAFVAALARAVDHIIAVPLAEAYAPAENIVQTSRPHTVSASAACSLDTAMQDASRFAAPRVLICGSFLLAAEALTLESD